MRSEPTDGAPGASPARRLFFGGSRTHVPGLSNRLVGDFKGGAIAEGGGGKDRRAGAQAPLQQDAAESPTHALSRR